MEAANLTAESAWSTFVEFAGTRFDVAADPESDRLLYQYGIYRFTGRPMSTLDLTRQFGMADNDGEDDHFVQFHCELRYEPVPELEALGEFNAWWFQDDGHLGRFWVGCQVRKSHSFYAARWDLVGVPVR